MQGLAGGRRGAASASSLSAPAARAWRHSHSALRSDTLSTQRPIAWSHRLNWVPTPRQRRLCKQNTAESRPVTTRCFFWFHAHSCSIFVAGSVPSRSLACAFSRLLINPCEQLFRSRSGIRAVFCSLRSSVEVTLFAVCLSKLWTLQVSVRKFRIAAAAAAAAGRSSTLARSSWMELRLEGRRLLFRKRSVQQNQSYIII